MTEAARTLPFAFAKRHGVLLGEQQPDRLEIICRTGTSLQALTELRRYLGRSIRPRQVSAEEFDRLLQRVYGEQSADAMQAIQDIDDGLDLSSAAQALAEPEDLAESQDDAPIIRLINALLTEAIKQNASDIHIEPYESKLIVRFRVDGVLREVLVPPKALAPQIVSRVKVLAKLDIAEKRLPQDGRISLRLAGRAVDVRVSTVPAGHGERVVLRLLDKQAGRLDLGHLGMDPKTMQVMDDLIHRPHGIILVTGPTGSGKTTTLYAALSRINDKSCNILTVEDPIEYYIEGISQMQVNLKVDLTFARGLRAYLRQDPDVIMVGEVRDLETAEIAVQASLTGHLVLSTLHTNTAVGAITRLRDMGVEPFLLASSLIGLMAQRLVRVLCPVCKKRDTADKRERELLKIKDEREVTLFHAVGCKACNQLSYRGRTGIYELIAVDDAMRSLIHDGASEATLEAYARKSSPSINDDGRRRILSGETTLEEVLRVTREG